MRVWTVLLVAALVVPAVMAQGDAPQPSVDADLLYAHGTGNDEANGFMNTLQDDGNDNAMGPSASCDTESGVGPVDAVVFPPSDIERHWKFTLQPALVSDLLLEAGGTVTVTAYIGSGSCDGDSVNVESALKSGDTTIAQGGPVAHTWSSGAPYAEVVIEMTVDEPMVLAADGLTWTIDAKGKAHGAMFLGVASEQGRTRVELPILPGEGGVGAGGQPTYQDLPAGDIGLDLRWDGGARTDQYNWTSPGGVFALTALGEITEGFVNLTLTDGAEGGLAVPVSGIVNVTELIEVAAGPWTLVLDAYDANGTLAIALVAQDAGTRAVPDAAPTNETEDPLAAAIDDRESPAPGLLVLPVLAAVALRRRR